MKNIISALFIFFTFIDISIAMTDTREYVNWNDYPNIVKMLNQQTTGECTGTQIGKYIITAAHCVNYPGSAQILKHDGTSDFATVVATGEYITSHNTADDWAVLSLIASENTDSTYVLSEDIESDAGITYGFGDLRILSDIEIQKIRDYLDDNGYMYKSLDDFIRLLHQDIPDVGYIYKDSERLKKSPCNILERSGNVISTLCTLSNGNSGGGLFVKDSQVVGIASEASQSTILREKSSFSSVKPVKAAIQNLEEKTVQGSESENCDEDFVIAKLRSLYSRQFVKIGSYYMDATQNNFLTDSCGNIVLKKIFSPNAKNIKSIEYINGTYKFIYPYWHTYVKCHGGGTNLAVSEEIDSRADRIDEIITVIDDNTDHDASISRHVSIDNGQNFYNSFVEACVSLFTQQEIDEMPEDWKECLGIDK
ncbi:MAG: hypothetical protein II179_02220 [Alphaproteobacteria bacterium]|nr:hypothetical protein [Alphaproteobacteria bacterium]